MTVWCYANPLKGKSVTTLRAFARACGDAEIVYDGVYREGGAVFYGVDRSNLAAWIRVTELGVPYFYVDNGYFDSTYEGGDYFRITKNRMQHAGFGESDGSRWQALNRQINPWRSGNTVLIALQSDWWYQRHGTTSKEWLRGIMADLKGSQPRPVRIRAKPLGGHREPPLRDDVREAHCVITHSSNIAVLALLEGVPVFTTSPDCAAARFSGNCSPIDVENVARAPDPSRQRWAEVLADNQWSLAEIRSGKAWADLNGH